jgi:hypothetical protein
MQEGRAIMESQTELQSVPQLTAQQRRFVKAILDGKNRMEAYRASYDTHAPSRCVSAQARNLWKNPRIQEAIARAQKGDPAVLMLCGYDLETCLMRKHLVLLQNASTPPYVQQRMLRDLWAIIQRKQMLESEKKAAKETPALEDIETLLRQNNGPAWDEKLAPTLEDDELTLDDDPLPVTPVQQSAGARQATQFANIRREEGKGMPANSRRDPFSTPPPVNRGLIRRFPNW